VLTIVNVSQLCSEAKGQQAAKTPSSPATRKISVITCNDKTSTIACESFKQLVEANDKDVLDAIKGEKSATGHHVAFVCLHPKADRFTILSFDEPLDSSFSKLHHDTQNDQLSARVFYLTGGRRISQDGIYKWYSDYSDDKLYTFGTVTSLTYQDGMIAALQSEFGYWNKQFGSSGHTARFEGQFYWLAEYNKKNNDSLSKDDDAKEAHIAIDESMIEMFYDFTNAKDGTTHYRMQVQRSTGRFIQSFSTSGVDTDEESGTCKIFK
jgi:hypothetical protein